MHAIKREAKGHIRFEAHPAMKLGGTSRQLQNQARDGVVDVIWTLTGYASGRLPCSEVSDLPFMMPNAKATAKALWECTTRLTKMLSYRGAVPVGMSLPQTPDGESQLG